PVGDVVAGDVRSPALIEEGEVLVAGVAPHDPAYQPRPPQPAPCRFPSPAPHAVAFVAGHRGGEALDTHGAAATHGTSRCAVVAAVGVEQVGVHAPTCGRFEIVGGELVVPVG